MNEGTGMSGEFSNWRDTGCQLNPSCLACPLERCIEEVPRGRQRTRMNGRARAMAGMRRQGFTSRQVAAAFGVSLRTVQRALEKHRDVEKRRDVASAASVKADIEGK